MKYANTVLDIIGNTPLIKLNKLAEGVPATVLVKLESVNPGGSVKDRIGIAMIEDAEKKGLLKKGGTIIEPTSGNTGVGLAIAAAIKGYRVIFTMPDKMSIEKEQMLRAYGAEVIRTPTDVAPTDPRSYYEVAKRLVREIQNSFSPNQYANKANVLAHYRTTGPEIWKDTEGKITHFVAGMGTGGTITGVGKYLKKQNPHISIIGADPEGSLYHHLFSHATPEIHTYKTEGIGEDFVPGTIDLRIIDDVVVVSDKEAFHTARSLVRQEGLLVGGSSGAAVYAALQIAKNLPMEAVIVVLLPDSGRNYISKVFNDEWMAENGFLNDKNRHFE
jgi:cystathionine beta-synthase